MFLVASKGVAMNNGSKISQLKLPAIVSSIDAFREFVVSQAEFPAFGAAKQHDILLALEEVLINVIKHAYSNPAQEVITVSCFTDDDFVFHLRVEDQGQYFNMLEVPLNTLNSESDIGSQYDKGFGCTLIKKLADKLHYIYDEGKNVLTLSFAMGSISEEV